WGGLGLGAALRPTKQQVAKEGWEILATDVRQDVAQTKCQTYKVRFMILSGGALRACLRDILLRKTQAANWLPEFYVAGCHVNMLSALRRRES
ncbi:hypothetical protein SZ10_09575, partial [Vibrio parahaemolyticus]